MYKVTLLYLVLETSEGLIDLLGLKEAIGADGEALSLAPA